MPVAPSRSSSRMQQYEDPPPSEDRQDPPDGAIVSGGGVDPEDADPVPPRSDKPANSVHGIPSTTAQQNKSSETEDEDYEEDPPPRAVAVSNGGYWRASRPASPDAAMADNVSENSSMAPRPKSRVDLATSRYSNLSYWRARRVVFYKNGDPFFPGIEIRFKPGRDIGSLESLLDKLSQRMDLPRGARFIFSMDGDRKYRLDELEDGASYVVSSYKTFKVSRCLSVFATIATKTLAPKLAYSE